MSTDFPREKRFVFVGLLFSLTAAEIARETSELVLGDLSWVELIPAYSHVILATIVVVTSWVGWSGSEVSTKLAVKHVFSWPLVVLLVDVALVILYFILVRGTEIPDNGIVRPSARNDCVVIALIFGGYAAWDFLTKAVISSDEASSGMEGFLKRVTGPAYWSRGWMSLLCMVLAVAACMFLCTLNAFWHVVLVDASLLSLVLFFRSLKEGRSGVLSVVLLVSWIFATGYAIVLSHP